MVNAAIRGCRGRRGIIGAIRFQDTAWLLSRKRPPKRQSLAATAGPDGLTLRGFRDGTPYQGEELVFEPQAPEHFLARCSRKGVTNTGTCLLERRIGNADITLRFPRDWLSDWKSVASSIDRLIVRLHPN